METLLALSCIVFVGYLSARGRIITAITQKALNKYVFYIAMPAAILAALLEQEIGNISRYARFLGINFAVYLCLFLTLLFIGRFMKRPYQNGSVLAYSSTTPNTVFLGFPLVLSVLGEQAFIYVVLLGTVMDAILNSLRIALVESRRPSTAKTKRSVRHIVKPLLTPITYATLLSFFLLMTKIELPGSLTQAIKLLGATASACALFALGVGVAQIKLARSLLAKSIVISVLKLVGLPLLLFAAFNVLHVNGLGKQVGVLVAALPAAVFTSVAAAQLKLNEDLAAGVILVSTTGSLITVPLWLTVLM